MPRIAIDTDSFVEKLFAKFGLSIEGGIGAAAFIGAAGVKAEVDQVAGGLRFQNHRINARFQSARLPRVQRFLNRFPADAHGIEFGDVEVVAQKITRTASVWSPRRDREADQAGTAIMKIAILSRKTSGLAGG